MKQKNIMIIIMMIGTLFLIPSIEAFSNKCYVFNEGNICFNTTSIYSETSGANFNLNDTNFANYYNTTQTNSLLNDKQNTLISGTNIKTINSESILGSGNIEITGGSSVWDTSGTAIYYDDGNVGIGTSSPVSDLHISKDGVTPSSSILDAALSTTITGSTTSTVLGVLTASSFSATRRSIYGLYRARGTLNNPSAVQENDVLGSFAFYGYDGSANQLPAVVEAFVDGSVSSGSVPARLSFVTGASFSTRQERLTIKNDGNVGIGTTSPSYPLEIDGENDGISLYTSNDISATGYITRTNVYDKTRGLATDKIKSSDDLVDQTGRIKHEEFYGYTTWITTEPDKTRPVTVIENVTVCPEQTEFEETIDEKNSDDLCTIQEKEITTYPYKINVTNEGVNLGMEIELLREAIYEIIQENKELKNELNTIKTQLEKETEIQR